MSLIDALRMSLASLSLQPGRALVAVSGGPDSVALLDLLVQSREVHGQDLVVAHVDHGIHPESHLVAEQVAALATSYGLSVHLGQLKLGPDAGETRARTERYAWLEKLRVELGASVVFTAHHADDQVETVLMRVLAGSGPAGLSGMSPVRGSLVRPLLSFSRAQLHDHVEESGLSVWVDPANSDSRHLRSWIRTDVLPVLRSRLPDVDANLLRTGRHAAADRAAWDSILNALPGLELKVESAGISVAAPSLEGYDSSLQQALILALARRAGCRLGPVRVGRVLDLLKRRESGTRVPLGGIWSAELSFGRLHVCRTASPDALAVWQLEGQKGQGSWGRWSFRWTSGRAPERQERTAATAWFSFDPLVVRTWAKGERVKPLGGTGRRLVVRCFQDLQVPRTGRDTWPVLTQGEEIVWIPGVCRSSLRLPTPGSEALRVDAEHA
jgi:tRNA(Ile)-lysidine synthase